MRNGISLIVLVITIIVMIILAATTVITLSNTGIINKANQVVNLSNEKQVQNLASLVWLDAYMDNLRGDDLVDRVKEELDKQGVKEEWNITVTDTGVTVTSKNTTFETTLGSLIVNALDYGKTVNYVSDNGVTNWKVFYHTSDYVYLIASEKIAYNKLPTNIPKAKVISEQITLSDNTQRTVGQIYWEEGSVPTTSGTITDANMWMIDWEDFQKYPNARCASYFLDETYWAELKNTTASYSKYVKGVIGTPTIEMFVASWNAKRELAVDNNDTTTYDSEFVLSKIGSKGYYINNSSSIKMSTEDDLYIWSTVKGASYWLAAPSGYDITWMMDAYYKGEFSCNRYTSKLYGVRPVICLSADIPAKHGTEGTTNFII